jgi:hypothetical protein
MSVELEIKKVVEVPTPPYTPRCIYLVPVESTRPAYKAWRIHAVGPSSGAVMTITELGFDDAGISGTPYAPSHDGSDMPDNAFDGDTTTAFRCSADYIIGKLYSAPTKVRGVHLIGSSNTAEVPSEFTLEASNNTTDGTDGHWVTINTWTGYQSPTPWDTLDDLNHDHYMGHLRIFSTSNDGNNIYEHPSVVNLPKLVDKIIEGNAQVLSFSTYNEMVTFKPLLGTNSVCYVANASDHPDPGVVGPQYFLYDKSDDAFSIYNGSIYGGHIAQAEW